jgi:para-aminobenzoate synthetase/4-amino-4-deoxychorismate lyase
MNHHEHLSCSILLDDAHSPIEQPTSRLYQSASQFIQAHDSISLESALNQIQTAIASQKYVVACFSYELGEYLVGLTPRQSPTPWVKAWIFDSLHKLSKQQVDHWLQEEITLEESRSIGSTNAFISKLSRSINEDTFKQKINSIQELIRDGQTYQVNFTYRINGNVTGSPLALYEQLREKQPGPFGAYIKDHDGWMLSCSPEWFLAKQGPKLITKPMKGTAKVGDITAPLLENDPKNRAENLMIVDLLRNDFGKISKPGSIKVPELFHVDQHGDVLQMTSTIESTAKDQLNLKELLQAIFPCGSITGAPKKRTMQIIQDLEDQERRMYCGAIAWFDPSPEGEILGDIGMSVVIRTIEIDNDKKFRMGVGGGITIDSDSESEWQECQTKAGFLYQLEPKMGLFETIRVEQGQAQLTDLHLERLTESAKKLNIPLNRNSAEMAIQQCCENIPEKEKNLSHRLRLDLSHDGKLSAKVFALNELSDNMKLLWARDLFPYDVTMISSNSFLNHKVTQRSIYDQAWQKAETLGSFDALFLNEKGYVTEGGRSNVFIKLDGQWLTPPIESGCLPGVMRSVLLKDSSMNAMERDILPSDVIRAEEVILCNALRGIIPIKK